VSAKKRPKTKRVGDPRKKDFRKRGVQKGQSHGGLVAAGGLSPSEGKEKKDTLPQAAGKQKGVRKGFTPLLSTQHTQGRNTNKKRGESRGRWPAPRKKIKKAPR